MNIDVSSRKGLTKLEQLENLPLSLESLTLAGRFNSSLEGVTWRTPGDDGPYSEPTKHGGFHVSNMGNFIQKFGYS